MIHTVVSGDTLYKIAQMHNTTVEELIRVNGLTRPNDLVIGQNIFIPTNTSQNGNYTVQRGDTLYNIARRYSIPLQDLINANPQIQNPNLIQIGQSIIIPNTKPNIEVNGYAIANISQETLDRTLPYLTYLSIFSHQAKADGTLTPLYENSLISNAYSGNVAPIMVVTNIGENGGFDSDLASTILNNQSIQNTLINNIISTLNEKNYYGVDIDFEYLYPQDRDSYITFLRNLKARLVPLGKTLSVAVAPKYRDNQEGLLYEAHDYKAIGEIADRVIIMTYEWGYVYGEPMAISPLSEVEAVISYAVTRIPSQKILMGMPNYAYDWKVPFVQGDVANTITNTRALEIAIENGANIMFDNRAQAPYFNYTDSNGVPRVVWFDDAKSTMARLQLVTKYNLAGVSYWTINNFYPVNWAVLDSMFNVKKVV
ncbi:MAG: LysM peptidoglycan-binding domain-containing protein [Clostridia bacterium]|nr:LysM peptidoglycan-binding domain-containing protein [Clostridia bacterium]